MTDDELDILVLSGRAPFDASHWCARCDAPVIGGDVDAHILSPGSHSLVPLGPVRERLLREAAPALLAARRPTPEPATRARLPRPRGPAKRPR